jgi:hypothetical protein
MFQKRDHGSSKVGVSEKIACAMQQAKDDKNE